MILAHPYNSISPIYGNFGQEDKTHASILNDVPIHCIILSSDCGMNQTFIRDVYVICDIIYSCIKSSTENILYIMCSRLESTVTKVPIATVCLGNKPSLRSVKI